MTQADQLRALADRSERRYVFAGGHRRRQVLRRMERRGLAVPVPCLPDVWVVR